MLKQRVITAIALVAGFLVLLLLLPPLALDVAIAAIVAAGAWEWTALSGLRGTSAEAWFPAAVTVIGVVLLWGLSPDSHWLVFTLAMLWWGVALICLLSAASEPSWLRQSRWLLPVGVVVLLPAWLAFYDVHQMPDSVFYILWFIALVAAADIGAYFAGKAFGRHKLAPRVSPNKTIEGFVGGVLSTLLVAWLGASVLAPDSLRSDALPWVLVGALILAPLSVVGDLFESLLKRQQNLKDSSSLLPGHGGVMDRLDSLTAALPLYALLLDLVVIRG